MNSYKESDSNSFHLGQGAGGPFAKHYSGTSHSRKQSRLEACSTPTLSGQASIAGPVCQSSQSRAKGGAQRSNNVQSRQSSIHMPTAPSNFSIATNTNGALPHNGSRGSSYHTTLQRPVETNILYESSGKPREISESST